MWTSTRVRSKWRKNWCPSPSAGVSTLDEARHVGQHEGSITRQLNNAKIGDERGERIVGDLRPRRRDARDERRFSHVGKAHQTDIGKQLQLQANHALLSLPATLGVPRSSVDGSSEMHIAPTTLAAASGTEALAVRAQIHQKIAGLVVVDHGPGRYAQHDVVAPFAVPVLVAAALSGRCMVLVAVTKIEQRRQALVDLENHAATVTAVAARGAALGHKFLAPEGHGAIASVATANTDTGAVDEGGHR
jgi:hypothetical protein